MFGRGEDFPGPLFSAYYHSLSIREGGQTATCSMILFTLLAWVPTPVEKFPRRIHVNNCSSHGQRLIQISTTQRSKSKNSVGLNVSRGKRTVSRIEVARNGKLRGKGTVSTYRSAADGKLRGKSTVSPIETPRAYLSWCRPSTTSCR